MLPAYSSWHWEQAKKKQESYVIILKYHSGVAIFHIIGENSKARLTAEVDIPFTQKASSKGTDDLDKNQASSRYLDG